MLLFILESLTWIEIIGGAITILIALALLKSGILQQLTTSTNSLLQLRTTERDDAIKEKDKWKTRVEDLEKENLVLRREITQQYVIFQLERKKSLGLESDEEIDLLDLIRKK